MSFLKHVNLLEFEAIGIIKMLYSQENTLLFIDPHSVCFQCKSIQNNEHDSSAVAAKADSVLARQT